MPTDIRHLELTRPAPAENLACDEALLNNCEANGRPGILRFWESPLYFIVIGYGNRVAEETDPAACKKSGVPILRRCSGGGSVVQGPGCLNYSLILPVTAVDGDPGSITATNRFVMERNRTACEALIGKRVDVAGHTDLAIDGRKFSGNSQRRRREWFLFHGTFLYNFDLDRIGQWLKAPPREPAYRQQRSHADFVTQLPRSAEEIKSALSKAWDARVELPEERWTRVELEMMRLVRERYGQAEWNERW